MFLSSGLLSWSRANGGLKMKHWIGKSKNDLEKFMQMPYMHSESMAIHTQAVKLFDQPGVEFNLEFELKHKAIIDRFGRYPHRNAILGRESTPDELQFLTGSDSSF